METRSIAEKEIRRVQKLTGIPLPVVIEYAGIPKRTWREWMSRRGQETRHNNNIPRQYYLTPEEITAIVLYCSQNQLKGHRMLRYEMIDRDVASATCCRCVL